jgi:hypothetical protein
VSKWTLKSRSASHQARVGAKPAWRASVRNSSTEYLCEYSVMMYSPRAKSIRLPATVTRCGPRAHEPHLDAAQVDVINRCVTEAV